MDCKEIYRRFSAWCREDCDDPWFNTASAFIGFGGWAFVAKQMGSTASTRWPDVRATWRRGEGKHAPSQRSLFAAWREGSAKKGGNPV